MYKLMDREGNERGRHSNLEVARCFNQGTGWYIQYSKEAVARVNAELVSRFPRPITDLEEVLL